MLFSNFMGLSAVFQGLGQEQFEELMRGVSMGKLRTFQVYDSFKVHAGMHKLNREKLRKALPRLWGRLEGGDNEVAREAAQAVLVSNLPFVAEVLDFLEIPHDGNGFFDKNNQTGDALAEGWQERVHAEFKNKYPEALVLLYTNHLAWETDPSAGIFLG